MMSLQPVTREQAALNLKQCAGKYRAAFLLAALPGIAVVVAAAFLVDDPKAVAAWVVLMIAGFLCSLGVLLTRQVSIRFRYRITAPHSTLMMAGALVAAVAAAAGIDYLVVAAVGTGPGTRRITVPVAIFVIVCTVRLTQSYLTLFSGSAYALIVRNARVPWSLVSQVVVAPGRTPDSTEIGVRTARPQPQSLRIRENEALRDLPFRVVVPTKQFDMDRLHWAINQSGRTDIALLYRTTTGEQLVRMSNMPVTPYPQPDQHIGRF
ncbi:hypothetical protein [Jongsikchunia kroppenstedtii]|uniref:hypothetical protein n=1 Tax=Jongsikchunia kroppenstedtii TaxID=1121721 RepID=UPI0003A6FEFA|nr:hypothetical protein [Jongsikchunia kroppenstedtii]